MADANAIAGHWAKGDVFALILSALEKAGKAPEGLTVDDLAPVDHFHARGFPATVELADQLPVKAYDHILDIGCGLGGPARYFAKRFGCRVSGIDITPGFVEAAIRLTALVDLEGQVAIEQGDGQQLPYADSTFDGAYTQHVTMNIADRGGFFGEVYRVLKPGAFFALTEHGMGPTGEPHHPVPWSEDGSGAYLTSPSQTRTLFETAKFERIEMENTGHKYLAAYNKVMELAAQGALPPLGIHILLGENAREKIRNAARNIEEGRTCPVQVICRKPS
jgi:SAM-dependent methyltransferase